MRFVEIMELASHMRPTRDLCDAARLIQPIESRKRIRLQPTSERGEVIGWMLRLAIWRVCKPHRRCVRTAGRPIVANVSPQAARFRFPVSRSQHRNWYIVGVDLHCI